MEKSIYQAEYAAFRRYLRHTRRAAGLTQSQLAQRLQETQSFVSKCERGERRLDIIEVRAFCTALGIRLTDFIAELEAVMATS